MPNLNREDSTRKIRICLAPAIWQVIVMVAALHQKHVREEANADYKHYLVIPSQRSSLSVDRKVEVEELVSGIWKWDKITWLEEKFLCELPFKHNPNKASDILKKYVGTPEAHEIWTCHLATSVERAIAEVYSRSDIILYEDGLATYTNHRPKHIKFHQLITQPICIYRSIKLFFNRRSIYGRIQFNSYLKRYSAAYLYLWKDLIDEEYYSRIPNLSIDSDFIKKVLETLSHLVDLRKMPVSSPFESSCVLVLGQPFSLGQFLSEENEVELYKTMIHSLLIKGYKVLWKEHPRSISSPLFPKLLQSFSSDDFKSLECSGILPIEVIAPRLNLTACISASSSSLFYLPKLYGIPTFSFAHLLYPNIKDKEAEVGTTNLVLEKIESIEYLISKERQH